MDAKKKTVHIEKESDLRRRVVRRVGKLSPDRWAEILAATSDPPWDPAEVRQIVELVRNRGWAKKKDQPLRRNAEKIRRDTECRAQVIASIIQARPCVERIIHEFRLETFGDDYPPFYGLSSMADWINDQIWKHRDAPVLMETRTRMFSTGQEWWQPIVIKETVAAILRWTDRDGDEFNWPVPRYSPLEPLYVAAKRLCAVTVWSGGGGALDGSDRTDQQQDEGRQHQEADASLSGEQEDSSTEKLPAVLRPREIRADNRWYVLGKEELESTIATAKQAPHGLQDYQAVALLLTGSMPVGTPLRASVDSALGSCYPGSILFEVGSPQVAPGTLAAVYSRMRSALWSGKSWRELPWRDIELVLFIRENPTDPWDARVEKWKDKHKDREGEWFPNGEAMRKAYPDALRRLTTLLEFGQTWLDEEII